MGFLEELKAEIEDVSSGGHPVTGEYSLDDQTAADELNAVNVPVNINSMTGSEVLNAVDKTEFNALTAADKQRIWDVLHLGDIDPFGLEAQIFIDVFGGGSTTITTLQGLRKEDRAQSDLLWGHQASPNHVARARALT